MWDCQDLGYCSSAAGWRQSGLCGLKSSPIYSSGAIVVDLDANNGLALPTVDEWSDEEKARL